VTSRPLYLVAVPPASPDASALRRVAQGDVGALGEVYERHVRVLLRFAARVAGPDDAEDIVQATFVRAAKVAGTYDDRAGSGRAWLLGIAARLVQERRRSLARLSRALLRLGAGARPTWAPPQTHSSDIEKGLRHLSDAKRVVLVLAEVEGFSCDEIARMLHVPVGTVWTRLHHARKELRQYYKEDA
jgi:DNA-directed RNA polymerase specialized sigma24 family protein